tara:strand:+ start:3092 stop:3328 length:237 start_codon:yes stop_codon:yes gene_type:complete
MVQQMEQNRIIELVKRIEGLLPSDKDGLKEEVRNNIKSLIEDYLHKLNLVTREEFDIQRDVLLKTRLKIEELEKKLNN